jgi:hypothetical protein
MDASAYIALGDATADRQHGSTLCLSRKDLTGYDFLGVTNVDLYLSMQPSSEAQLGDVIF